MEVSVGVFWHVVVEDDVHALDVHAAAEQVGGNQNALKNKTRNDCSARWKKFDKSQSLWNEHMTKQIW